MFFNAKESFELKQQAYTKDDNVYLNTIGPYFSTSSKNTFTQLWFKPVFYFDKSLIKLYPEHTKIQYLFQGYNMGAEVLCQIMTSDASIGGTAPSLTHSDDVAECLMDTSIPARTLITITLSKRYRFDRNTAIDFFVVLIRAT